MLLVNAVILAEIGVNFLTMEYSSRKRTLRLSIFFDTYFYQ